MRFVMPMVATIAAVAVLFHAGPRQAFACTCAPLPDGPSRAREVMESVDVLVLGEVDERTNGEHDPYPTARVRVERAYAGNIASDVAVRSANCNGIIVDFKKGQRWLMALSERDGGWQAHGCSAGLVDGVRTGRYNDGDVWLAALDQIVPPPTVGDTPLSATVIVDDEDDAPTLAIASTVVGLMTVMLGCVYLAGRRARV
ncbi:MAG: hypothetical protein WEB52_09700 [Dehalococcoidia bacterium]